MKVFCFLVFYCFSFGALGEDSCRQSLSEQFPRSWRIDQTILDKYWTSDTQDSELLKRYSAMAFFIDDPSNNALFDWLGAQYFLSLTDEEADASDSDKDQMKHEAEHLESLGFHGARFFIEGPGAEVLKNVGLKMEYFTLNCRIPLSSLRAYLTLSQILYSKDPEVHASMEALDGNYDIFLSILDDAKYEAPIPYALKAKEINFQTASKIKLFLKTQGHSIPTYLELARHSQIAQKSAMSTVVAQLKMNLSDDEFEEVLAIYKKNLAQEQPVVPQKYKKIIDILADQNDEIVSLFDSPSLPKLTPKMRRELSETFRLELIRVIHLMRFKSVKLDNRKNGDSSFLFWLIVLSADHDKYLDQELEPMIYRSFVTAILNKRVLSAAEYRAMLQSRLKQKISLRTRELSRSAPSKTRVTTSTQQISQPITSRIERITSYVRPEQEMTPEPIQNEVQTVHKLKTEPDILAQILDSPQDLNQDRIRLLNLIQPDVPIRITLKRFGFVYTVSFSARALTELSSPHAGLPQDFRPWLKAMSMGPARDRGQNGWKKMNTYEWKIKILTSPYRLYGYRDGQGEWHFTHFELEH